MEAPNMDAGIGTRAGIPPKTRDPTLDAPNEEGIISGSDGKKYLSPLQKISFGLLGLKVESLSERMVRRDLYKTATGAVDSPEYIDMVLANLHQERARSLAFFDTVDRVSHASVERMRNLLFPVKKAKTAKKRWFGKTLVAVRHPESYIVPKEYDSAVILPLADWKQKMWEDSSQRRMAEGERLSQERAATEAWYDELIQGWNNDRAMVVANRKILAEAALVDQERRAVEPKGPTTMRERLASANRLWTSDIARGERKVGQDNRAVEPKLPHAMDVRLAAFNCLGASDLTRGPCKADREKGWVESKAPPASDACLVELDQLWASDPLLARLAIKATRLIPRQKNLASPAQIEIVKGDVQAQQSNLMEDFKADIKRALERGTQGAPGEKKHPINVTVLDLSQGNEKVEEADGPSTRHIERLEEHVALKAERTRYRRTLKGKNRLKGRGILLANGSASQRSHPSAQTQKTQSQDGLHAYAQEMQNDIRAEQQQAVLGAQEQMGMNMGMNMGMSNPDNVPAHQRAFARRTQQGNLPDGGLLMDNIAQQTLPAPPVEQWTQFQINMQQQQQPQARMQGQRGGDLEAHGQQALCSQDLSQACAGVCEDEREHAEGMKEESHCPALISLSASHASSTTMGESLARFYKRRILVLGQTGPIRWDLLPATEFATIREILGHDWNLAEQERCMDGWLRKHASTVLGNLTPPAPLPNEKDLHYILNMLGSSYPISVGSGDKAVPPHPLRLSVHDLQDYGHRHKATFQFVNEHIYGPLACMDISDSEQSNSFSLQLAMREKKLNDEYDDKGWGYINANGYIAGGVGMPAPNPSQRQANYHLPNPLASAEYRRQIDYHNPLVSRLPKLQCSSVNQEPECDVFGDTLSCISCKCKDDTCNCDITTDTPGIHTSAFIRNIRRCARFVDDVVRHDHAWLCQGYPLDYTSSSSECLEAKCDDDCGKCCSRKSASLPEPSKLAGRRRGGGLAAEFSLKLAEQPTAGANVATWESNNADAGGGTFSFSDLLQTRLEASDTDDSAYFLRAWNVRAMNMGWWHSKGLKGKEPPNALLPPHLHDLRLEPPFREEIEQEVLPDWRLDKWSIGRCLVYLQDPYDTVDWRIRQADMSQKRRREQDIQEAVERETLVKVSWFGTKDHVPKRHKRMEPTPPVSAAGLRGGCLDADPGGLDQEHHAPSTTRKRRRTLLDSDPVYQSSKRKWTGERSFISTGPPQTVHPPRAKRQNIDTTPRYLHRAQSPIPNPPPSPPGTPPRPPATVTAARPHWWLPPRSELGRQRTNRRPDPITLNLDFIPLDLPRTRDLKKFCGFNTQTLGVMGRTVVQQRLSAEEIWSELHGLGRARRDSGFVEMPDAIESIFTDCAQSCRGGRRDSAVLMDEEEDDTVMHA